MALVKFARGTKANYNHTTYADYIYFAEDTGEILMNNQSYGGGSITKVEVVEGNSLKLTFSNGTSQTFDVADLLLYNSQLDDSVATVSALGGIAAGTTVAQLKSKTLSQVFDELIFPTVNPTFDAPKATMSTGMTSPKEIYSNANVAASFTYKFDKGAIKLGSSKQADRAGAETGHTYQCKKPGASAFSDTIPATFDTYGTYQYQVVVNYAQGPQPKDSKGNNYSTPLAAGSVTGGTNVNVPVSIQSVYPFYTNGASASTTNATSSFPEAPAPDTKVVVNHSTSYELGIAFASEAKTSTRAVLEYAADKGQSGTNMPLSIQTYNTVSGKWETPNNLGTATSIGNKNINGTDVPYVRWTTTGPLVDTVQYRFQFSK